MASILTQAVRHVCIYMQELASLRTQVTLGRPEALQLEEDKASLQAAYEARCRQCQSLLEDSKGLRDSVAQLQSQLRAATADAVRLPAAAARVRAAPAAGEAQGSLRKPAWRGSSSKPAGQRSVCFDPSKDRHHIIQQDQPLDAAQGSQQVRGVALDALRAALALRSSSFLDKLDTAAGPQQPSSSTSLRHS